MNLKKRRCIHNLTMKQVADAAGISESMYCLVENGRRTPSLKVLKKLARALGCTVDELIDASEEKGGEP
mgnify:CR=1 FL=1